MNCRGMVDGTWQLQEVDSPGNTEVFINPITVSMSSRVNQCYNTHHTSTVSSILYIAYHSRWKRFMLFTDYFATVNIFSWILCTWVLWNFVKVGNHESFFRNEHKYVKHWNIFTANNKQHAVYVFCILKWRDVNINVLIVRI